MNRPTSYYNETDAYGSSTERAEKEDAFICRNDSIKSFLIALSAGQGFNWISRHGKGQLNYDLLMMVLKETLYQVETSNMVLDKDEIIGNIFDELPDYLDEYLQDD